MNDDIINQIEEMDENLHKWFKEKWVRFGPDGKIRGDCAREKSSEGKPKCRPLKSAQAMGKKARATAASRKRREDPNPDRSGKAKNVKTEEITPKNFDNLNYIGNCKDDDVIEHIFGDATNFAQAVEKYGNEFTVKDLVVKYDPEADIHSFYYKNNEMNEHKCPICGGELVSEILMNEKKDACYYKVKSRYSVWPSAYASGALVKCRKKGAKNWGNKSEGFEEVDEACWKGYHKDGMKTMFGKKYPNCVKNEAEQQREELEEKWSEKYKSSIDCSHPKGFSQKAHCQGRKKTNESIMKKEQLKNLIREMIEEMYNEQSKMQDECLECYESAMQEGTNEIWEDCYRKTNLDMIPEGDEHTCEGDEFYEIYGDMKYTGVVEEAEYHGRKVKLGVPMRGDVKKSKVFVKNAKGNVVKVNFGDKNMRIKKSNPKRRKSFRARHNCANPGPRTSAKYWSCRAW